MTENIYCNNSIYHYDLESNGYIIETFTFVGLYKIIFKDYYQFKTYFGKEKEYVTITDMLQLSECLEETEYCVTVGDIDADEGTYDEIFDVSELNIKQYRKIKEKFEKMINSMIVEKSPEEVEIIELFKQYLNPIN